MLQTLSILASHDHVSAEEILAAARHGRPTPPSDKTPEEDEKSHPLESDLLLERRTREFLETEVTELQNQVSKLLRQWRDEERHVAILRRRIERFHEPNERLVEATRAGVESLQKLQAEFKGTARGAKELGDHVRKMRAIVEAVQAVRDAQNAKPAERHAGHDAR